MSEPILMMPFITDSPEFSYGFQCGQLSEKMSNSEVISNQMLHTFNNKQIELMAQHFGYEIEITTIDEDWSELNASPINISNIQL